MQLGSLTTPNNVFMAPLAGVGDIGLRILAGYYGAGLTYTEMLSVKALTMGNAKTFRMLAVDPAERLVGVQLFGSEPEVFAQAVKLPALDKFPLIDINMGCPVPKIVKSGEGSALMDNPALAYRIVAAVVKAADGRPVTVKFRLGRDDMNINCAEFAKMCEEAGAAAVTVHARTRAQLYSGAACWEYLAEVKQAVKIPVIANGDINSRVAMEKCLKLTGCDGVAIGRAALYNPHIFAELTNTAIHYNKWEDLKFHLNILVEYFGERTATVNMRKHFGYAFRGEKDGKSFKERANFAKGPEELCEIIDEWLMR